VLIVYEVSSLSSHFLPLLHPSPSRSFGRCNLAPSQCERARTLRVTEVVTQNPAF
jgi:hypothetical protein